jgi:hypothetical protein
MLVHLVATQTPCSLERHPKPIKIDFVNSKNYTKLLGYIKDLSIDQSRLEETFRGCLMSNVDADFDEGFSTTATMAIYDECAQYWKEFVAISISHYSRICNSVTHELARQAY